MEGISRREVARRHGIGLTTIRKRIADGSLAAALLPNGNLDPIKAAELIAATVVKSKAPPIALHSAKTRKLRAQVERLRDEVDELRSSTILATDAQWLLASFCEWLAGPICALPTTIAKKAAGQPGRVAMVVIRDAVNDLLAALHESDPPDVLPRGVPDEPEAPEADLASFSPAGLMAVKFNLEGERIERHNALARGELITTAANLAAYEERLTVMKSLLMALPGRLAAAMEPATRVEARKLAEAEMRDVLAALT